MPYTRFKHLIYHLSNQILRIMQMIYFLYQTIKLDIVNYGQLNIKFDCLSWTLIDVAMISNVKFIMHLISLCSSPLRARASAVYGLCNSLEFLFREEVSAQRGQN